MKDGASMSSLAIAEKRPLQQKPGGGCIGVFYQLFNWKKKLFSKKLLPPTDAEKRVTKKFACREERMQKVSMAKLLLIADENHGGFPNRKRSEDDASCSSSPGGPGARMRAPGLVARLMGLESMPVVHHERPRKASGSKLDGTLDAASELEELRLETDGYGKAETRPQKLQKTGGFSESRPVTGRFSSNALQFDRSMLSSSRRQHQHHKLASPVKSPRMFSRRNKSRLMDAAIKILEPGLQSRNQGRCALTYISSSRDSREGSNAAMFLGNSGEPLNDSLVGSCKNCGSVVEVTGLVTSTREAQVTENGYSDSDLIDASQSHGGYGVHKLRPPVVLSAPNRSASPPVQGKVHVQSSPENGRSRATSLALQAKINVQSRAHELMETNCRKTCDQNLCKAREEVASRSALRRNNLRQNQLPSVHEKAFMGSEVCRRQPSRRVSYASNGTKDFVALNRDLNNCKHSRSPSKVLERNRVEMERNDLEKKNVAHKRRPISNSQIGNAGMVDGALMKQRSVRRELINETRIGVTSTCSINKHSSKNVKQVQVGSRGGNAGLVSFTSPVSHCSRFSSHRNIVGKRRSVKELVGDNSISKKLVSDIEAGNLSSLEGRTPGEDAVTALLEQQMRESSDRDGFQTGDALPGRPTASIIEELIPDLSNGSRPPKRNCDGLPSGLSPKDNSCCDSTDLSNYANSHGEITTTNEKFQAGAKTGISMAHPASDGDHPSPISILEASFSNDSCHSWCPRGCSGRKMESTVSSCNKIQALDPESYILDSASSINVESFGTEKTSCSVDYSSTMHNIDSCGLGLKDSKLRYYINTISNAGLLLESISSFGSNAEDDSSIGLFLHDMIEAIINASHSSSNCSSGFTDNKEGSSLRQFLFDCMIECLDSKYSYLCSSSYKAWLILPLLLSQDRLVREVKKEIAGWTDLAGKTLDVLIEKDMDLSTRKWTEFKVEAFEIGMSMEDDILQVLIHETVVDFCLC